MMRIPSAGTQPHDAESYLEVGRKYFLSCEYRCARVFFGEALRLEPGRVDALLFRGHSAAALGDFYAATCDYREALAADRKLGAAYEGLGSVYLQSADFAAAAAAYQRCVECGRRSLPVYYNLVSALAASGDRAAALMTLSAAEAKHAGRPELAELRAQIDVRHARAS